MQAEADQVALRAVCCDQGMYERALEQARMTPLSVRGMAEAVAMGWYTDAGWVDRPGHQVWWWPAPAAGQTVPDHPPIRLDADGPDA